MVHEQKQRTACKNPEGNRRVECVTDCLQGAPLGPTSGAFLFTLEGICDSKNDTQIKQSRLCTNTTKVNLELTKREYSYTVRRNQSTRRQL